MKNLKSFFSNHPFIFLLVGIAFAIDITGVMQSIIPRSTFGLPSLLVVIYCIGSAILIRFLIARRRVHSAVTWTIIIALYVGWFIIMAALSPGQTYRPSLLFMLSLVAAYKTLRFQLEDEIIEENKVDGV